MSYFIKILEFVAGLGVFLFGMKLISEGLEQTAGGGIRKLFNNISDNRIIGVGVGAGVTAVVQSSSATTVMVLGFVNAGLMTLFQATTIIMGANIGTTITAVIVSLKVLPISNIFAGFTVIGVFMIMLSKKDKIKTLGSLFCGIGLIFIGLNMMSSGMNFLRSSATFANAFANLTNPLLLVIVGAVFTALIQSSSGSTAIVITMVALEGGGLISLNAALYIILGTNIGTCITALLASIGGCVNTKRTAFIHFTFNIIGTIIFLIIIMLSRAAVGNYLNQLFRGNLAAAIAAFHIIFNVTTTFLLLPFIKQLVHFSEKVIKEKDKGCKDSLHLKYLDERILSTPSIAVSQIVKEVVEMNRLTGVNLKLAMKGLINHSLSDREEIVKRENEIDYINKAINKYMIKVSSLNISDRDEMLIGVLFHIVNDIERIGDHAENFSDFTEYMSKLNLRFTEEAQQEISQMYKAVNDMFRLTFESFRDKRTDKMHEIYELEDIIDAMKEKYSSNHIVRLSEEKCNVDTGAIFFGVLGDLERIADHLINIANRIEPDFTLSYRLLEEKIV